MPPVAVLDALTRDFREQRANELRARGNRAQREGYRRADGEVSHDPSWWYERADALDRGEAPRLASCGESPLAGAACPCCRRGYQLVRTCGSRWCGPCSDRRRLRATKAIVRALRAAEKRAWAEWRRRGCQRWQRPQLRLLTLTGPHSGMLHVDRDRLQTAWKRARSWLHAHDAYPYSYVVRHELSEGADGRGHWHLHIALFVPWVDWRAFHVEWSRALEHAGAAAPDWGQRAAKRSGVRIENAAAYIAKYIAKPCPTDDPELAARFYETSYARRLTHASDGFWIPWLGCCNEPWHRVRCDDWQRLPGAVEGARADVELWQRGRAPPRIVPRSALAQHIAAPNPAI